MPSQRFSSLRNAGNGVLEEKLGNIFLGEGEGGMVPDPLKRSRKEQGRHSPSIGDEGYLNSVQPPLSEIPGSAPDHPLTFID